MSDDIFSDIPDPPTAIVAQSTTMPLFHMFRIPFVGGSNMGDSLLNKGYHVWPDLAVLDIGGVKYLYPEAKVEITGIYVREGNLADGSPYYRKLTDDDDITFQEDPQIAANPTYSRLYMDFDPFVQTIRRDFPMEPGKEYFLGVIELGVGFPGGAQLSGRYVVVPTDQASGPLLPGGIVEVRGGVFESNWLREVSITGETAPPVGGATGGTGGGAAGQALTATGPGATLVAGAGDDTVSGLSGANYLRGSDGNDLVRGGSGFDDAHGNAGNDTVSGGIGDDWTVGGKGNDLLSGEAGGDLVYGNLGADTCDGGDGDDIVRGGQDNDVVRGGAGRDYVSGDRGDDTVSGGLGADDFHTFGDAGLDRVIDFNRGEGDRVLLDPGTQYSVAQVGADTVITMVGGGQMVLVGVGMASLTGSWIVGA